VSFGNPTLTMLTAPSGEPATVVTLYVFPAGAAPGEAGPLLYYRIVDGWTPSGSDTTGA